MDSIFEREGSDLGKVVALDHIGREVHPELGECFVVRRTIKVPLQHDNGFYIPDRDIILYPIETHMSESQYRQEKQLMDNDSNEFVNTTELKLELEMYGGGVSYEVAMKLIAEIERLKSLLEEPMSCSHAGGFRGETCGKCGETIPGPWDGSVVEDN